MLERWQVARRIRRSEPLQPPVFIIGHWRSGTTHLYNTMSRSSQFGFVPPVATGLPWDMLLLGRLCRPLLDRMLPEERFIDPIPVAPDSPQEDEAGLANMQSVSFYHGLYFPCQLREKFNEGVLFDGCPPHRIRLWQQRFVQFLHKVTWLNEGRRLLIKNPVYTARIAMLRELFPGARFIHVHRHPHEVFRSMRNFYPRLLEAMALQRYDHADVDALILESYPRMMDQLIADSAALPAEQFVEVAYDDLRHRPMAQVERICAQLQLPLEAHDRAACEAYLGTVEDYHPHPHVLDTATQRLVNAQWGRFMVRWGYQ